MKHTHANPHLKWDGFRFATYYLDAKKVLALQLTQKRETNGKEEEIATTVEVILERLSDRKLEPTSLDYCFDDRFRVRLKFATDVEELDIGGPSFNLDILKALLELRNAGVNPFDAEWFWYEAASCMEDPHEIYTFFVVANDSIILERVSFSDFHESGFDPTVFQLDDSKPLWSTHRAMAEARNLYWYRKFCAETRIGQIMCLQSDEPELLDFVDGRASRKPEPMPAIHPAEPSPSSAEVSSLLRTVLAEMRVLQWILVVLGVLVIIALWLKL